MSDQHSAPSAPPTQHPQPSYDRRDVPHRPNQPPSRVGRIVVGSVVLVGAAIAAIALLATRKTASAARDANTRVADEAKGPIVRLAGVTFSPSFIKRELLGEARPYASVTFYAKVSGYLKTVPVDMGDHVHLGQVLATIESPETDRAYLAAKADYDNKQVITGRVAQLLQKKMVSPQEADQARTDAAMAQERLNALSEERDYETLHAAFGGVVTARYADPGALLQNAASSQTSALPVVTIAETDSLRVFVYLDQGDAAQVHVGTPASITLTERPGYRLPVRIARVSGQLDQKTRKMMAEIDVQNRDGVIVPGGFVQVELDVPTPSRPEAPVEALIVRGGNTFVAAVGPDSKVHFQPVAIVANDGKMLTFSSGVQRGDRLALSLGSGVQDGAQVQVDTSKASTQNPVNGGAGGEP